MKKKSKMAQACEISVQTRESVYQRDGGRCVLCGERYTAMPNAHYIPRSQGGLGVEQNVVTLCWDCHHAMDNTMQRPQLLAKVKEYLRKQYPAWDEESLVYQKYS